MEIRSTPLISGDFTHDVRRLRKCQRPLTSQIAGWKEYESQRHVALNWARRLKRVFGVEIATPARAAAGGPSSARWRDRAAGLARLGLSAAGAGSPHVPVHESTVPNRPGLEGGLNFRNGQPSFRRSFVYVSVTRNCRRSSWHRSFVCSP